MIVGIFCVVILYLLYIDAFGNYPDDEDENWLDCDGLSLLD